MNMNSITAILFERPRILWALAALVVPAVFILFRHRQFRSVFAGRGNLALRCLASSFCVLFSVACVIVALAGPRWGLSKTKEFRRGLDVVFVVDVSRSMELADTSSFRPNSTAVRSRLEQGLVILQKIAAALEGSRTAVVIGRGRGVPAVPLSYDGEALGGFLRSLSPASLSGRGTNLESLLNAGIDAFPPGLAGRAVIVLVSDGESLSGSVAAAFDRAQKAGISIAALGPGSNEGRPLPQAEGAPVISRRQEDVLRRAASETGGIYIDANRDEAAAELLRWLKEKGSASVAERGRASRWRMFVVIALILFGLSKLFVTGNKT